MKFLPRMALLLSLSALPFSYAAAQQLLSNPANHGYGPVQIGTSQKYAFRLTNSGKRTVRIFSVSTVGSSFSIGSFPVPVKLHPGTSTQLPVIFTPSASGRTTGRIAVSSDAVNRKLVMQVWGRGVAVARATLGLSPASLNFGKITVASSASLQLTLSASNGSVTISSAQSNSSEFDLPGLNLPLTIKSGGHQAITVRFTPNASGTASANLTLVSNAANSPTVAPLTGVGVVSGGHSADLSWDASQDPVIGYNVYRGGKTGGPYSQVNSVLDASTNYTDSSVKAGATYFYVVKAVDANNQESAPSNEAKVKIPSP